MKVALFVTCLCDQIYPEVGVATVRLLRRLGCEVEFPRAQTCCGQPLWNSGYAREAREIARGMLDAFDEAEHVVTPSGSCAGMIAHSYAELFANDPVLLPRARALAAKTRELAQFLVHDLGVDDVGARFAHKVTYHPACHGTRLLGVKDEPLRLLSRVEGIEIVPLTRAEDCCGFGGLFAGQHGAISGAMVGEKVERIEATAAPFVVGTDMGCLMNIAGLLRRRGSRVRALHLAQVLEGSHVAA